MACLGGGEAKQCFWPQGLIALAGTSEVLNADYGHVCHFGLY